MILHSVPKKDGFRMPGEFEPHAGCWMLWPFRPDNWRLGAKPAQRVFAEVAGAISRFEPVTIGVTAGQFLNARNMLPEAVRVVELSCNDAWMRDSGPTFLKNSVGDIRLVDWEFNAWGGLEGGLYFPWDQDNLVALKVAELTRTAYYKAPIVLEGGSIHTDGQGTLITTEECLLNENRNPGYSKEGLTEVLQNYLGIEKIIWLRRGVYNDETDGHVDNLCCYIRPGVVALTWTDNRDDPQYEISMENLEILKEATDARGRSLEIHTIHQPEPILITREESENVDSVDGTLPRNEGDRLAASYINFYIAEKGVVMPLFNDPQDRNAMETLKKLFPAREVVGVGAREILLGGGNIHCITQQQPV